MIYEITCTFKVCKLKNLDEAEEFGINLTEHILDTFNDNGTISPLVTVTVEPKRRNAQ